MSEVCIPCDKIARLSNVLKFLPEFADEWTDSFRLEDDCIMATNRCYMAVERISANVGQPVHIKADPAFVSQCVTEAKFSSNVYFVINVPLGIVTARTTLGYQYPGNLLHRPNVPNKIDSWRSIVPRQSAKRSKGGLMIDAGQIMMLVETSPSRQIVFEENIDTAQPTIVRDLHDPDWFGVFNPKSNETLHDPAKLPGWFV